MKLTTAQLDEIERAAKKATPGPWWVDGFGELRWGDDRDLIWGDCTGIAVMADADAEHIATMDPATTLALVAELRELRADLAMLREADQDDAGRFIHSPHLQAKWGPRYRRLMRERDQARLERDDAKVDLAAMKRDTWKQAVQVRQVRAMHAKSSLRDECLTCTDENGDPASWPCDTIKVLGVTS